MLTCNYSTSTSNPCLYWYRQLLYSTLEYILRQPSSHIACPKQTANDDKRFISTATASNTELIISNLMLSDSAVYYCVLGDSHTGKINPRAEQKQSYNIKISRLWYKQFKQI
ncbi:hypothetical protein GDO86_001633 [Hymenochirus boettgeri]|uniref:Ig-like domain-containing protein n=1 Tax=Hymenochirus boettgeri TaxID=247094 RepID=A0A8T2KHW6_9PIPI|nr:hypothetical protein GDO86_001633 [Hymenochirus boettgeri]